MVQCAAFNCQNYSKSGYGVSFFRFPKDKALLKAWIHFIKRKNFKPTEHSRICSVHFTRECFEQNLDVLDQLGIKPAKLTLTKGAIPTIFNFNTGNKDPKRCCSASDVEDRPAYSRRKKVEVCYKLYCFSFYTVYIHIEIFFVLLAI